MLYHAAEDEKEKTKGKLTNSLIPKKHHAGQESKTAEKRSGKRSRRQAAKGQMTMGADIHHPQDYTHKEASRNHGGASRGEACTEEQGWQMLPKGNC